jgi:hypothetical protein
MTDERMALKALVEKTSDADLRAPIDSEHLYRLIPSSRSN